MKTQLIGSGWVTEGLRPADGPFVLGRPADEPVRFAGVERAEADRFAGPFDALFGVRVAMMPKVRRRHRVTRGGSPGKRQVRSIAPPIP
ncbi:hypothetical protein GCM10022419_095380 [Nonomuraea rosea]|uniref:Uncharacterized protein n=1 Tax=Nonomuraea rosea TaxID=638574 RepID=A0ABP6Z5I5_9ACTN